MGTLMTIFSGVATLMCLLVGLQLFILESQIGQANQPGLQDSEDQLRHWQAQAHTGAIMSFGAGALIFLFGLRHLTATGQGNPKQPPDPEPGRSTVDLDSVSVRVFEVDAADRSVEITPGAGESEPPPSVPLAPEAPVPADNAFHLDHLEESEPCPGPLTDPAETIVRTIRDAATAEPQRRPFTFLLRLFRWGRHRPL